MVTSRPWPASPATSGPQSRYNTSGSTDSTLTVNNSANYTFSGKLGDRLSGSGTGRRILVQRPCRDPDACRQVRRTRIAGGTTVAGFIVCACEDLAGLIAIPGNVVSMSETGDGTSTFCNSTGQEIAPPA